MRWQDIVIAIVQVCFVFAMIPSITSKDKPALATSVMNVVLVSIISVCLFTLQLWLATATAILVAITWGVLAVQKKHISTTKRK